MKLFTDSDRFVQFQRKVEIFNRLYHKIKSLHFISVNGILRHIGNKNKRNLAIKFPQFSGGVKTIHMRHFNIHKSNVAAGFIIADKI
jgi:hypothetical protein